MLWTCQVAPVFFSALDLVKKQEGFEVSVSPETFSMLHCRKPDNLQGTVVPENLRDGLPILPTFIINVIQISHNTSGISSFP